MQVKLHDSLTHSLIAREAADGLESCVHCGFCLATCPTYLDTRDERDSPRGRLSLLRGLLEDGRREPVARHHLDRCLGCRSCESTCPSGVPYAQIADVGKELLESALPRPPAERVLRWMLRAIVPRRRVFAPLLRAGQTVRPLLPRRLRAAIPQRQQPGPEPSLPGENSQRRVVLLEGCVQSSATPNTNQALRRILARLGIGVIETPRQGCCGALNTHLGATEAGRRDMRQNIDAWWTALDAGAEVILVGATGCGAQVQDYARALRHDPDYAARAAEVSARTLDPALFLASEALDGLPRRDGERPSVAVHAPCSQTHALRIDGGAVPALLACVGYHLAAVADNHLCCGSAGSYSILQPAMSRRLRERKLSALTQDSPAVIATANVGCQLHLQGDGSLPVRHWLELLDDALEWPRPRPQRQQL
jgi:glycolate oxidase iron-sulfur subunit